MLNKKAIVIISLIIVLAIASGTYAYFITANQTENLDGPNSGLFVESFNPFLIGDNISGGNLTIKNLSNKSYANLQLTVTVDDSPSPITDIYRMQLFYAHDSHNQTLPLDFPVNFTSIEANQSANIRFNLVNTELTQFNQYTIKFFLTQDNTGDLINGQSFILPQKKAYLQIIDVSPIHTDDDTWHLQYNSNQQQYEYVNDAPNYYQQTHKQNPLSPIAFNWSRALNQIGETYFNITVCNNNTFPVKIPYSSGGSTIDTPSVMGASRQDAILQPNQTYIIPSSSTRIPQYIFVSGDLT